MAEIIDVSGWSFVEEEPGGADQKRWLTPARTDRSASRRDYWLFKGAKYGREKLPGDAGTVTYRRADDHAEWLASRVAGLLQLPAAEVCYASDGEVSGIISRNVAPDGWEMEEGDLLLLDYDGYVSCRGKPRDRAGHSLDNIEDLMRGIVGPPSTTWAASPAFDVFVGYLVLDAWIANTDRHALNWSLMRRGEEQALAPSFDHGSSLGSGSNERRVRSDLEAGVGRFCSKGFAHRFEGGRKVTLTELALRAAARSDRAGEAWFGRLEVLSREDWEPLIAEMNGVSEERARFLSEVLDENRRRLLDARPHA